MRVFIVDDDQLIRESLSIMLDAFDDVEVVGKAENGKEALNYIQDADVELLLLDIRMPIMDGVEVTRVMKSWERKPKILILTTFTDHEYIYHAINNGANGYILKSRGISQIYQAMKSVMEGQVVLDTDVTSSLLTQKPVHSSESLMNLTDKEYQILQCIGNGYNNKEISAKLFLSEGTIRNYISLLLDKLELRDRTQLAIYYVKNYGDEI